MRTLLLAGLVLLSACGKQEEKNYYSNTDSSATEEAPRTEEQDSTDTYVYGKNSETLTKALEFDFPIKTFDQKRSLPDPKSTQFYKIFEVRNLEIKNLNYQQYEKGTRELIIKGKHITLDLEDKQNILSLVNNAEDLSKLTIEADTLEITTEIKIPQTNLVINAREIIFSKAGSLNTTPKTLSYRAEQFKDGKVGLNAGNIEVNFMMMKYINGRDKKMFVADGGGGQEAGDGQNGARGHNAIIVRQPNYREYRKIACPRRESTNGGDRHKILNKGRHAGNGQDAIKGGAPGEGGQAGEIVLNNKQFINSSQKGGVAGFPAFEQMGGEPGVPATTCKLEISCRGKEKIYKCATAVKGANVESPVAIRSVQPYKKVQVIPNEWLTDSIIDYNIKYLEELYFRGHIETALLEKYKIDSFLNSKSDLSPSATLSKTKLQTLEYQMASRLDFYGNPAGWTPSFNFNLNFRAFKTEVQRSLKTLFFTELLKKKLDANDSVVQTSKDFQFELIQDAKNSEQKLTGLIESVSELTESIADMNVVRDEFNTELKMIEKKIKKLAQRNLAEPFMNKAVKIFAAVSKVIPVGQPALALVGQGIEMVHTMSQSKDPVGVMINKVPNFLGKIGEVDFALAGEQLSQKLSDISLSKLGEFSKAPPNETRDQMMARLKKDFNSKKDLIDEMVGFYGPIVKSVKEQTEMMRTREVSKSAIEREIAKIKKKHKMFNKLSKLLETLQIKQEKTNLLLKKTTTQISVNFQKITENLLLVSDLYTELGSASKVQSHVLHGLLDKFRDRAINNLKFYHYKLAKSYEYKTLTEYRGELNLDLIYSAMMELLASGSGNPSANDLDYVMIAYENELSKIIGDTLERYENGDRSLSIKKKVFLSENEIEAINRGEEIFLDLSSAANFGANRENVRLENIHLTPKASGSHGDLEIMIEHDKKSVIRKGEDSFVFAHTDENLNQHKWITSLNLPTSELSMSETSKEDLRILESLLGENIKLDKMYANPSARGFYKVSMTKSDFEIQLHELEIEFEITFQYK